MTKCPQCGRTLREHERYCDFCEQDITKEVDKAESLKSSIPNKLKVKTDFKGLFNRIKKFFRREK